MWENGIDYYSIKRTSHSIEQDGIFLFVRLQMLWAQAKEKYQFSSEEIKMYNKNLSLVSR